MSGIVVNTRILSAPITGIRRYTEQLLARWNGADTIAPTSNLHGISGHAWEQLIIPVEVGSRLLFSPSNTGPITIENQVVTVHDMAVFDCPSGFTRTFASWYRYLLPRIIRRARHIVTVSEFIRQRIVEITGVSSGKITVIPNGVEERFNPGAASNVRAAAEEIRLPSLNYVLAVGSLEPRKNLARLFQAWSGIQDRLPPDMWLVVAGMAGQARVFAADRGRIPEKVFFAGHVNDKLLPCLYAGALATAYVSLYEGFGLPPLEAMATGTPVVVSNCSSLPEVVGEAAVLVDPYRVDNIAGGLMQVLSNRNRRDELRDAGLQRARKFSWDSTARQTWEVLQVAGSNN